MSAATGAKKKAAVDLATLVDRYRKARLAGKHCYERADRLIQEIVAAGVKAGDEIKLSEAGRKAVLHDKFAEAGEKGVIWTPCGARRWDLEIIEP